MKHHIILFVLFTLLFAFGCTISIDTKDSSNQPESSEHDNDHGESYLQDNVTAMNDSKKPDNYTVVSEEQINTSINTTLVCCKTHTLSEDQKTIHEEIIWVEASGCVDEGLEGVFRLSININPGYCSTPFKICPDEWYINQMPMLVGEDGIPQESLPGEYFILDGKRAELSEFDMDWIHENCDITPKRVW